MSYSIRLISFQAQQVTGVRRGVWQGVGRKATQLAFDTSSGSIPAGYSDASIATSQIAIDPNHVGDAYWRFKAVFQVDAAGGQWGFFSTFPYIYKDYQATYYYTLYQQGRGSQWTGQDDPDHYYKCR